MEEGGGRPPRPPRSLGEREIREMERPSRRRRCGGKRAAARARRRSGGFASLGDAVMMLMTGITGEGKCAPVQGDGKSRRGVHCMVQICRIPNGVSLRWTLDCYGVVAGVDRGSLQLQ